MLCRIAKAEAPTRTITERWKDAIMPPKPPNNARKGRFRWSSSCFFDGLTK